MIFIRKQVHMSLDGVAILWHVQLHSHDEEDGSCVVGDWFTHTWPQALIVAQQIVAQEAERFVQCSATEWRLLTPEAGPEEWCLSYICHTCTEVWGEARYTSDPAQHLAWHRKRLGPGRDDEYKLRISHLKELLRAARGGTLPWVDLDVL